MKTFRTALLTGAILFAPTLMFAHPGHDASGVEAGFAHPLSGLDHLLAMFALGLWAAQLGRRMIWLLPASVLAAMICGGSVGMAGWSIPFAETHIAVSVLISGLLVMCALRLPVPLGIMLVAVFAFCHGNAHGAEMPAGTNALSFSAGLVMASGLLQAFGVIAGMVMREVGAARWIRLAGFAIAITAISGFFR